jgi:hypothetical protein
MWWKEFVTWVMSVYPHANPVIVAVYSIFAFIFVWFFKEFKNQYAREVEKKHERVDKTIEMYAELLATLTCAHQEDTNQDVHRMIFKLFPYVDKEMYDSLKEYANAGNLESRQTLVDKVYERINRLKTRYNYINHHYDFTFTGAVESFGLFLRNVFIPFFYTLLVFAGGIFIVSLYSFSPDDPFRFLARVSSSCFLLMLMLVLGDVWLKEGFLQNIRRNGASYLFILLAPVMILFIPHWITVILGVLFFVIGISIKKMHVENDREGAEPSIF